MDTLEQSFNDFVNDVTNEVAVANSVPPGEWEGVVNKCSPKEIPEFTNDGSPHFLFGVPMFHVEVDLLVNGKSRKHWIDVTSKKLTYKGGSVREESRLGAAFGKLTKTTTSLEDALTAAKGMRLLYVLSPKEAKNGSPAGMWTTIKAVKA